MKKILMAGIVGLGLIVGAYASDTKDTTFSVYGVGAKTDKNQNSSKGLGLNYDTEELKVKIETTSDYVKTGAVYKFTPMTNLYFKVGGNFINQKMYAPDSTNARVNQYSGALASGYMLQDDLYGEIGVSYTRLNGSKIGTSYEIVDETTKQTYIELAKRWEVSSFTIDTSANFGRSYYEYKKDENSYGTGLDIYPTNSSKISYSYQNEKDNIASVYGAEYNGFFVEYADNLSNNTYTAKAGVKIAFTDLFDISTYKMPTNIKPHLSELHKFENITFSTNMNIQSSQGVKMTDDAIALANAPTINTIATQNVNDNGGGLATTLLTVSGTNIQSGAVFSIVADPTAGGLTINSSTGVLVYDKDINPSQSYTITIKVVNPDGGSDTETFTLNVTDNA
ncbi:MAG: cadherin repeat domain-containing protein [Arcobacter sp.]|uniref:cadherin repeat domain-containing protein n=1 Tax=Arcobacter sp. TaxID=1872629 RepID=UPI003AFF65CC